jgi:hypothetical protein
VGYRTPTRILTKAGANGDWQEKRNLKGANAWGIVAFLTYEERFIAPLKVLFRV